MGISMSSLKPQNNHGETLPEEVILSEILPKLPAKSLMRFKCVSKRWLSVIADDARLREAHARHRKSTLTTGEDISSVVILAKYADKESHKVFFLSSGDDHHDSHRDLDDQIIITPKVKEFDMSYLLTEGVQLCDDIDIIGSSNGLVLLSRAFIVPHVNLILWNPTTRKFRYLPKPALLKHGIDFDEISHFPILDLGFDDKNDDHKVVRVVETSMRNEDGVVVRSLNFQVYSKKADSWRKIKTLAGYRLWSWKLGITVNGVLYFLALQVTLDASQHNIAILSFNYRDEEVRNLAGVPNNYPGDGIQIHDFDLTRWKDNSLALIAPNRLAGSVFDFWVMVENGDGNGNGSHWLKLFEFNYRYPICGVWWDRFLIVQKHRRRNIELLMWDPFRGGGARKRRIKLAKLSRLWYFTAAVYYVPSLVSVYPDH